MLYSLADGLRTRRPPSALGVVATFGGASHCYATCPATLDQAGVNQLTAGGAGSGVATALALSVCAAATLPAATELFDTVAECDNNGGPGRRSARTRRQLTNWDLSRADLDAINLWQGTVASTDPDVAPLYEYQRAALGFRVQIEQWGQMFFEEPFFLPDGSLSGSAQGWAGMDDRDWVVGLGSAMLAGSDSGSVITMTEVDELGLYRPVERRNATSIPVTLVELALQRWNSTALSAFGRWFGTTTNVIDLAVWVPAVAALRLDDSGTDRFVALMERHAAVVDAAVADSPRSCARIEQFPDPPQLRTISASAAEPVGVMGSITIVNVCDEPLIDVAVVVRLLQPATTLAPDAASDAAPTDGSDGAADDGDSGSGDEGSGSSEDDEDEGGFVLRLSVAPVPAETSSVIEWSSQQWQLPPDAIAAAVTDGSGWTVGVSLRFGVGSSDPRYTASSALSPIAAARTSTAASTMTSSAPRSTGGESYASAPQTTAPQTTAPQTTVPSDVSEDNVTSTTLAVDQAAGGSSADDDDGVSAGGAVAIVLVVVIAVVGAAAAYKWANDNSSSAKSGQSLAPTKLDMYTNPVASAMNRSFAVPSADLQQPSASADPNASQAHLLASSAMGKSDIDVDTLAGGATATDASAPLWGKQLNFLSDAGTVDTDVDADGSETADLQSDEAADASTQKPRRVTDWAVNGQEPGPGAGEVAGKGQNSTFGRQRMHTLEPFWPGAEYLEGATPAATPEVEELLMSTL